MMHDVERALARLPAHQRTAIRLIGIDGTPTRSGAADGYERGGGALSPIARSQQAARDGRGPHRVAVPHPLAGQGQRMRNKDGFRARFSISPKANRGGDGDRTGEADRRARRLISTAA